MERPPPGPPSTTKRSPRRLRTLSLLNQLLQRRWEPPHLTRPPCLLGPPRSQHSRDPSTLPHTHRRLVREHSSCGVHRPCPAGDHNSGLKVGVARQPPSDLTYRGRPAESLSDFLRRLLLFLQVNHVLCPQQKAAILATTLKERAWAFYTSLSFEVSSNFDALLVALSQKFGGPSQQQQMREALRNRKQGPHEDIDATPGT